ARGRGPRRSADEPLPAPPAGVSGGVRREDTAGEWPRGRLSAPRPPARDRAVRASLAAMNTNAPRPPSAAVPSPSHLLDIATAAAFAAAEYIRGLDRDGLAREYKTSSHDIVTEHDRASEEIIVS